jgi:hypothetical protein
LQLSDEFQPAQRGGLRALMASGAPIFNLNPSLLFGEPARRY